jgi:hypothetical protein
MNPGVSIRKAMSVYEAALISLCYIGWMLACMATSSILACVATSWMHVCMHGQNHGRQNHGAQRSDECVPTKSKCLKKKSNEPLAYRPKINRSKPSKWSNDPGKSRRRSNLHTDVFLEDPIQQPPLCVRVRSNDQNWVLGLGEGLRGYEGISRRAMRLSRFDHH